jgi:RNA polymerase sigma-70 factor, ECF subfamily
MVVIAVAFRPPTAHALAEAPPAGDPLIGLVCPATQGDHAAMRALLGAVAPVMLRAARRLLGRDHPDVDDVAQQALVGLVERLPLFRGESSVAHFAERIAVYRALTARRDAGVRQRVVEQAVLEPTDTDAAPSPFAVAASRARLALLHDALDTLAPPQAEALALHFLFDHTVAEIAAMTDAAEETVRSRLRLGKQALRANIEKNARLRALRDGPASDGATAPPEAET